MKFKMRLVWLTSKLESPVKEEHYNANQWDRDCSSNQYTSELEHTQKHCNTVVTWEGIAVSLHLA